MHSSIRSIIALVAVVLLSCGAASAQSINLLPKYGPAPKSEAYKAADQKFLATIDEHYKGDRKKASEEIATRGWQILRQGQMDEAMRRFNQAWLLNSSNGVALWGMGAIQANKPGHLEEALKLFAEAAPFEIGDVDFSADYAKTLGMAGAATNNEELLKDAFSRFAEVHAQAPQHTLNLQNWAITYFYIGNYAEAWKKVALAEATPRRADLDSRFVAALQNKMPRP